MRGIRWGRSQWRQKTRFERYADGSWAVTLGLGRAWITVFGEESERKRQRAQEAWNEEPPEEHVALGWWNPDGR